MRLTKHFLPLLALVTAFAALAGPVSASDAGRLDAYVLAPVGNLQQNGIDFGIGYAIAKVGPVRISPLVDVSSLAGNATFHYGAAATIGIGKHFDVGLAEVQRPGSTGLTRIATSAIVGVRL